MSNYNTFIRVLDELRKEAPPSFNAYHPLEVNVEKINQARARAYIHLYLKSRLGILEFEEREKYITDGTHDGGIDGYYIDYQERNVIFIQSKFRTTENNFEQKEISLEEILKMDIDRITSGETEHENGVPYNSKIQTLLQELQEIPDIGRYKYEVILLANLKSISDNKLKKLSSGLPINIYDFKRTFTDLVFPVICGTYYNQNDLCININLTNKSSGANINYSVKTELGVCNVTVLFAPLYEVGKLMHKYKNSILKYNPRSYLTLKEGTINEGIKQTIIKGTTNEFALFNNGITVLSDETHFNQKIGQKDIAQLVVTNPQIINGGQTAYTLSIIYEESISEPKIQEKLKNKEVLIKVITFSIEDTITEECKLELIKSISEATNKQNQVNNADRNSNNSLLIETQKSLFEDFGFLLERKRGEFYDGLRNGYIDKTQIIDRSIFMRISYACLGFPVPPKKEKQLLTEQKIEEVLSDKSNFKKYFFGCLIFSELKAYPKNNELSQSFQKGFFAIIAIISAKYYQNSIDQKKLKEMAKNCTEDIIKQWNDFENYFTEQFHNVGYFKHEYNYHKQSYKVTARYSRYFRSQLLPIDINDYFFNSKMIVEEDIQTRKSIQTLDKLLYKENLNIYLLKKIEPYINKSNWFDKYTIEEISIRANISKHLVRVAIKFITSKEYGYYISKAIETGASI